MKINKKLIGIAALAGAAGYYLLKGHKVSAVPVVVRGCTNPLSFNYNPLATEEDGSCISDDGVFHLKYKTKESNWMDICIFSVYDIGSPVTSIYNIHIVSPDVISWATVNAPETGVVYDCGFTSPIGVPISIRVSLGAIVGQADNLVI